MIKPNLFSPSKDDLALLLEIGFVYRYAGRFREARESFLGVKALIPSKEVGDLALAGLSFDEGDFSEAETCCQRAISINPRSLEAYLQLAEVKLYCGEKAAAMDSLKNALDLKPRGPAADLARALLKLAEILIPKGGAHRADNPSSHDGNLYANATRGFE